jgi:hypothetical protein
MSLLPTIANGMMNAKANQMEKNDKQDDRVLSTKKKKSLHCALGNSNPTPDIEMKQWTRVNCMKMTREPIVISMASDERGTKKNGGV